MSLLKSLICSLAIVGFLASCASSPAIPLAGQTEKATLLQNYMKSHKGEFLQADCKVFNSDLSIVLDLPGDLCIFNPDGSTVIAKATKLQKYDSQFRLIWEHDIKINHQMKLSTRANHYLAIDSRYKPFSQDSYLRYDALNLIASDGKIVKSFDFSTPSIFSKFIEKQKPGINGWTADGFAGRSYEKTHVNSFSEIYALDKTQKKLVGYIAASAAPTFIAVFDANLKPTKFIDLNNVKIHDIQQSETKLDRFLFYINYLDPNVTQSAIGSISLEDPVPQIYYQNSKQNVYAESCSSVDVLSDSQLLVLHSNSSNFGLVAERTSAKIEFVDLKTHQSELIILPPHFLLSSLRVVDLKSYFQNNMGH